MPICSLRRAEQDSHYLRVRKVGSGAIPAETSLYCDGRAIAFIEEFEDGEILLISCDDIAAIAHCEPGG